MNIEIRYLSKSGNTEKIAKAIGEELNVTPKTIETPIDKETDLLFLGGAYYGFDIDTNLKQFISNLDPNLVKNIACFSTSSIFKGVNKKITKHSRKKDINVLNNYFHCKGEYLKVNTNKPNEEDLKLAKEFAKETISNYINK